MINVAFITPSLNIGGAEKWVLTLANNLSRVKAQRIFNFHGKPTDGLSSKTDIEIVYCYGNVDYINDNLCDIDIIISWGSACLGKIDKDIPIIDVAHSDPIWPAHKKMIEKTHLGATHYVGVSQTAASSFPNYCETTTIYNGIDPSNLAVTKSREEQRAEWGLTPFDVAVLYTGGTKTFKGSKEVLEVAKILHHFYKVIFVNSSQQHLDNVITVQPTLEIGNYYNAADILLTPSKFEGMPLTLLEAWCMQLPVLATRYNTYIELEKRHNCRLGIDLPIDYTIEQMKEKIQLTYEDLLPKTYLHEIVKKNYTQKHMVKNWENYLLSI